MRHVHFIGIAGVGMSGLAQVLLSRGDRVTGSDPSANEATERLIAGGATIYRQQVAENITGQHRPDLVVVTAAVHEDNPELVSARAAGIPVVSRAKFLGTLMAESRGPRIAVSGTHGKTTTTAMVAEVLLAAGMDPTVLVGGEYAPIGGNVRIGQGGALLTEACEAYDSFLSLRPDIAVITNVEADHLDHYGTEQRVLDAFVAFARQTSADGCVVWCAEDAGASNAAPQLSRSTEPRARLVAYGFEPCGDACVWAEAVEHAGRTTSFTVHRRNGSENAALGEVTLHAPGMHNVLNALAAVTVGLEVRASFAQIAEGLAAFQGTGRRFQVHGEAEGVLVIDDYAHHPTEIRATISATRDAYPGRRLLAVFQPHLYSRTRDFMDGFAQALSLADAVVVTDIYAAREQPIPGVSVPELVKRIADIVAAK